MHRSAVGRGLIFLLLSATLPGFAAAAPGNQEVRSPDGSVVLTLYTDGPLAYDLNVDGKPVILRSAVELDLAPNVRLGPNARLAGETRRSVDSTWINNLGNNRNVRDRFNEIELRFKDHGLQFNVIARAYNEGAAFRLSLLECPA